MDWKRVGVVVGVGVAGMMFAATVTVNSPAGTVTNANAFVTVPAGGLTVTVAANIAPATVAPATAPTLFQSIAFSPL